MFDSELQADGIDMTFVVDKSYKDANLDAVYCDPVRLTQIFINLLTNASVARSPLARRTDMFRRSNSLGRNQNER